VATGRTLKLLLIEDNLEDENLIREALIEIEENRQWGRWNSCYLAHADRLSDGLEYVKAEQFDAILLNLSLPDAPVLFDTLQVVQSSTGSVPIVVLADEDDPVTAQRLIREGAQDVIVKAELECAPLARTIRHAIERHRRNASMEANWFLDDLTGAYNRRGFLHMAGHHLRIARRFSLPTSLVVVEFERVSGSREASDLALIRATEVARIIFPEDCLIGHIEAPSLGLLAIGMNLLEAQACADCLRSDLGAALGDRSAPRLRLTQIDPHGVAGIEDLIASSKQIVAIPAMLAD
jgi:DNA-binding NarL/FixJ family response regulator